MVPAGSAVRQHCRAWLIEIAARPAEEELRIECAFPADEDTAEICRRLAEE